MMRLARLLLLASLLPSARAAGQGSVTTVAPSTPRAHLAASRDAARVHELIAANMVIGGLTAATRAALGGRDPLLAFITGTFGGATHFVGKALAVKPGDALGLTGLAVSSVGASMVSNAGRGVHLLDEVTIPVLAARLRIAPFAERKVFATVNAYEAAILAHFVAGPGRLDWGSSLRSGAAVVRVPDVITVGSTVADGMAVGPVVVVALRAQDPGRTLRHELLHVHQHWFAQTAWGDPIEGKVRSDSAWRFLPSWLDVGATAPALRELENRLTGGRGYRRLREHEAETLAHTVSRPSAPGVFWALPAIY